MARHVAYYTIEAGVDKQGKPRKPGRDEGKLFKLTEMSATAGELWAVKAFTSMANNNIEVPDNIREMGMAGLASYSISMLANLRFNAAKELMEEMFQCVEIVPDPNNRKYSRVLHESDIEEISTRLTLRVEILKLHLDFLSAALSSTSDTTMTAQKV